MQQDGLPTFDVAGHPVWRPDDGMESEAFRKLGMALAHMTHGLALYDANERLVLFNDRYRELLGLPTDVIHKGVPHAVVLRAMLSPLLPPDADEALDAKAQQILRKRRTDAASGVMGGQMELALGPRIVSVQHRVVPDGGWVVVLGDATERRRNADRLLHLAQHDLLTGLANRSGFRDRLAAVMAAGDGAAVLYLDLDRFKPVNDTLGHEAGDVVLSAVARRISEELGPHDLSARLGGDEFAVLLVGCRDTAVAAQVATRLIEQISRPVPVREVSVVVSASVGIRMVSGSEGAPAAILGQADLALYRAKDAGRGCLRFFAPAMEVEAQRRRTLEGALRDALHGGEFSLHYQPIVNTRTRSLTGFEALLRWTSPSRGTVAPVDFIPFAEEIGMMPAIGEWVLRTACLHAVDWPDHLTLAVNLSPTQLAQAGFIHRLESILTSFGMRAERLEVEVTETAMMRDVDNAARVLEQLRVLGVRVSLDDFGTGYSSLSFLRRLPFTRLKIDRSFIADMEMDPDARAIVRALMQLCGDLNVIATAEGVESERQISLLQAENCSEMQGFLIGRPCPVAEVPAVIAALDVVSLGSSVATKVLPNPTRALLAAEV